MILITERRTTMALMIQGVASEKVWSKALPYESSKGGWKLQENPERMGEGHTTHFES